MDTEHTYDLDNAFDSLFGAWRGQAIGLLDLDAFFASVEQLDHPEWRACSGFTPQCPPRKPNDSVLMPFGLRGISLDIER